MHDIRSVLERTLFHAFRYLDGLDSNSVAATASLSELRSRLAIPMADCGADAVQVIDELVAGTMGGHLGSAGGRFFAWVIGGSLPAALAADWLTSVWDQNAALYSCAPASGVLEEIAGNWLKEILGLPSTASFAFTTGCQMAHLTCLAAARNAVLKRQGWDVETRGLAGAPHIRILSSDQSHGSIERAARLLGIGANALRKLPSDEDGMLQPSALKTELERDPELPTIVILQAGDLNIGAYDSFSDLVPLVHAHCGWVHVDGAFGLWAAVSPKYKDLLRGVEDADSWATDGHKWLNTPYDCGYAFVADREAHRTAMSHRASYLTHDQDARDQIDWNPEWSRRGRGAVTYAALRELGRQGLRNLIERTCAHAHALVTSIGGLDGAEVVRKPRVNQGLVRFLDTSAGANDRDHDQFTQNVIAAIAKSGEAFFSPTNWQGKHCMRVSVCNWRTTDSDIRRSVNAAGNAIEYVRSISLSQ
jgi:glutamate/tyrosine decarboxylase-like PLP-dependent enzyme